MEQVPDDFVECWATGYWACLTRVCTAPLPPVGKETAIQHRALRLVEKTYALTALKRSKLTECPVPKVMQLMNDRFAARLGVDAAVLMNLHFRHAIAASA
jgi:hypothetical protein